MSDQADADTATDSAPRTARARARAELTAEIADTARRHLEAHGAAGLSLRAISRDLGMVSSALYRYFPSRDALLTALIIDAYDAIGEVCEVAEAAVARDDLAGRWGAIAHAARGWALAHPHEYALIYGTPVPGYAAPTDTIDPASRVTRLLVLLLSDIDRTATPTASTLPVAPSLSRQLDAIGETLGLQLDEARLLAGIGAWTQLFGMLSFEVFGQFQNVFDDAEALFAQQVHLSAANLGIG